MGVYRTKPDRAQSTQILHKAKFPLIENIECGNKIAAVHQLVTLQNTYHAYTVELFRPYWDSSAARASKASTGGV